MVRCADVTLMRMWLLENGGGGSDCIFDLRHQIADALLPELLAPWELS